MSSSWPTSGSPRRPSSRASPRSAPFSGTAAYLAPEQARGEEAGPSADLYALGVVTYQLISGRLPYEATSLTELALKQQQEEPATLDTLVAAVSPELADAVAIALALDPRDRYKTAQEMRRALHDGARGVSPGHRPATASAAKTTQATTVLAGGRRAAEAPTTTVAHQTPQAGAGTGQAGAGAGTPSPQVIGP